MNTCTANFVESTTSDTSQWEKKRIPNKNMFVLCSFFEAHIKNWCNLCAKQPLPLFHTSADTIDRCSQRRTSNHYSLRLNKVYPLIEPYDTQNNQKEQSATNTWEHRTQQQPYQQQQPDTRAEEVEDLPWLSLRWSAILVSSARRQRERSDVAINISLCCLFLTMGQDKQLPDEIWSFFHYSTIVLSTWNLLQLKSI